MPERLAEHKDMAMLSYQLATIKTDCQLKETLEDLRPAEADVKTLEKIYQELEFRAWVAELQDGDGGTDKPAAAAAESEAPEEVVELDHKGYQTDRKST